jgi:hypothetical protein
MFSFFFFLIPKNKDWRNSVLKTNPLFSDATLPKKSTRMSTLRSFFEQEMRRRSSSPLPASPDSSGSSPQLDDGTDEEDEEDAIREFTEEQERVLELSVVPPPLPRRGVNPRTGSITGGLNPSPSTPLSKHQGGGRFSLQYSATEQQRAIQLAKVCDKLPPYRATLTTDILFFFRPFVLVFFFFFLTSGFHSERA